MFHGERRVVFVGFSQADVEEELEEAEQRVGLRLAVSCGDP